MIDSTIDLFFHPVETLENCTDITLRCNAKDYAVSVVAATPATL